MMKTKAHSRIAATKIVDGRQFIYCGCGKRWGGPAAAKKRRGHLAEVQRRIANAPAAHIGFSVVRR